MAVDNLSKYRQRSILDILYKSLSPWIEKCRNFPCLILAVDLKHVTKTKEALDESLGELFPVSADRLGHLHEQVSEYQRLS